MIERLLNLFRRRRLDRELDVEMRFHLESLEAEHRARGLGPEAARLAALRDFGGLAQIREAHRDQRGIPMFETLWRDVRFSVRSMRRTPMVTLAVIATLAIGIGANTAIFSVVNGVLLKPLPYPEADRLITMAHTAPGVRVADVASAAFLYFTEREQNRTLESVGLLLHGTGTVTGRGEPAVVRRSFVTSEILPMLRIPPLAGRYFTEGDDSPGSPNTIVLAYGYWQRRFGGDPHVIGQSLTVDGEAWTIIGVTPERFRFPDRVPDVITPLRLDRSEVTLGGFFQPSIARLKPGVTLEQANEDVRRMIPIAQATFPLGRGQTWQQSRNARLGPNLRPLKQDVVGNVGSTLWVLMGTIGIVLLIACANVANLILARTEGRQHELSIRAALGAGWRRIARELLAESGVLSLAGGALGVGFAYAALRVLLAAAPANLPRRDEIVMDPTVLLFTLGLSVLSGLLFGAIPVLRFARPALAASLRAGGRAASTARERLRVRGVLVVAQVALALVLLVSAGLMIRTLQELNNVNPGFAGAEQVQTVQIRIPGQSIPGAEQTARTQKEILDRLLALPGVSAAAYVSDIPMGGGVTADLLNPEGKVFAPGEPPRSAQSRFISPGVFSTLRIPLVAGRDMTWTEVFEKRDVALVSEDLARKEWGSPRAALGKRLRGSSAADAWREIVGVAGDVHDRGLNQPVTDTVYYPVLGERVYNNPVYVWRFVTYVIRSARTGTPAFLDEIRKAVWAVNADLPLVEFRSMGDVLGESMARTSFTTILLSAASGMALLLGLIGIYAVISYTVTQRSREVGIRIALGAESRAVRRMFVRQGLALAAIGTAAGLGGSVGLTRWLKSLLFEVSPLDPWTYVVVSMIVLITAGLACYLPARRATCIDPVEALRAE